MADADDIAQEASQLVEDRPPVGLDLLSDLLPWLIPPVEPPGTLPSIQSALPPDYVWVPGSGAVYVGPTAIRNVSSAGEFTDSQLMAQLRVILRKLDLHQILNSDEASLLNHVLESPETLPNFAEVQELFAEQGWMDTSVRAPSNAFDNLVAARELEYGRPLTAEERSALSLETGVEDTGGPPDALPGPNTDWKARFVSSSKYREWARVEGDVQRAAQPEVARSALSPLPFNDWLATVRTMPVNMQSARDARNNPELQWLYQMYQDQQQLRFLLATTGHTSDEYQQVRNEAIARIQEQLIAAGISPDVYQYEPAGVANLLPRAPEDIRIQYGDLGLHPDRLREVMRSVDANSGGRLTEMGVTDPTNPVHLAMFYSAAQDPNSLFGNEVRYSTEKIFSTVTFHDTASNRRTVVDRDTIRAARDQMKDHDHILQSGTSEGLIQAALRNEVPWQVLFGVLRDQTNDFQISEAEIRARGFRDIEHYVRTVAMQLGAKRLQYGSDVLAVLSFAYGDEYTDQIKDLGLIPVGHEAAVNGYLSSVFGGLDVLQFFDPQGAYQLQHLQNSTGLEIDDPLAMRQSADALFETYFFRPATDSEFDVMMSGLLNASQENARRRSPFNVDASRGAPTGGGPDGWIFPVDTDATKSWQPSFNAPWGDHRHAGIDVFAAKGTAVFAPVAGRIIRQGNSGGAGGNRIWLQGDDGRRYYFAHLDGFARNMGTYVQAGDTIGFVGNTGNAAGKTPHVHFGITDGGYASDSNDPRAAGWIDPAPFLASGSPGYFDGSTYKSEFFYWDPDARAWQLEVLENMPEFSELYGKREEGQTVDQYLSQFRQAGANVLGFEAPAPALEVGLRTNDITAMYGAILGSTDTVERSPQLRQRLSRLVGVIGDKK